MKRKHKNEECFFEKCCCLERCGKSVFGESELGGIGRVLAARHSHRVIREQLLHRQRRHLHPIHSFRASHTAPHFKSAEQIYIDEI